MQADPGPNKRDLIAGLEKGLAVIEAFDQERPKLSITEVAERAGLTRAAARRYLITLTHLGYVQPDRRMYGLTPKVLRLGQSDQELELGLRTIAVPLKNFRGDTVAAMNVSVHAARVRMDELVDKCLPALLQAQAQLRTLL